MLLREAEAGRSWGKSARMFTRWPAYWADARAHPGWMLMFVFGRILMMRRLSGAFAQRPDEVADGDGADALADVSVASVVEAIRRDGIYTGLRLPAATVKEIRAFADSRPCFGSLDPHMPFLPEEHDDAERRYGRAILVGHFLHTVLDCQAVADLVASPWLRAVAAGYLRAAPKVIATRLWWSFRSGSASPADLSLASQDAFHFDLDDWRQLKFFFYLTDVDKHAGPHVYARGSHARRPLSHQFTLFKGKPDAEIIATYGADAIETVTGTAGSGFVEDPFGYHTGSAVQQNPRLVLEVSFGISGVLRRRPFGEISP